MKVFADTAFFIAVLHGKDSFHGTALEALRKHRGNILTSPWVVVEVCNYFARGAARELAIQFLTLIQSSSEFKVLPLDTETYSAGLRLYMERADKNWSLTDYISMCLLREHGLTGVLTSDHHFKQAGYDVLLDN